MQKNHLFDLKKSMALGLLAFGLSLISFMPANADNQQQSLRNWNGVVLQANKWKNPFIPSDWRERKLGDYWWKASNARIVNNELQLTVSEKASAQVQSGSSTLSSHARWDVDVTLPKMRPGLIAAPLWTFHNDNKDEIDFEVVGVKGLVVTVWTKVNGAHTAVWSQKLLEGDLSGKRLQLAIDYEAGNKITFFVDGKQAAAVTPNDVKGGHFPAGPQKAFLDLWVAQGVSEAWAGKWTPLAKDEKLTMIIHRYGFIPD
jgi:hypothetical protein